MQYRTFGKTGKEISSVGFGCMRLPMITIDEKRIVDEEKAIPLLRKAYERGINYFDTAVMYCDGLSQPTVGKAIKSFRENVMLSTKLPLGMVKSKDDFRRVLNESLQKIDTNYIDFYHFHGINKGEFDRVILGYGLMNEARKAIDEGLIRHISFSFHDRPEHLSYIIDRGEIFSSVLIQYNLLDRSNEEGIAYAAEKGLGVVVMGPVAGGRLSAQSGLYQKLLGKESSSTPELALRFVLGNKNVSCALSGMGDLHMLEGNLEVAEKIGPLSEEEWKKAGDMMQEIRKFSDLYCTGCNYCQPCPKGINIPHIFNAYTYYNAYGLENEGKRLYKQIGTKPEFGAAVSDCVGCGACDKKCPQAIPVMEKLKEVDSILSK